LGDVFGDTKDVTGTEDMAGVEDMMTGVEGTTGAEKGAETAKNGISNDIVILVTKTMTRSCREVLQDNCRFCGRRESALVVSYYR
jgi:hypothetical protein